jgi:DNA-binding beta-propeller fold protein YncE
MGKVHSVEKRTDIQCLLRSDREYSGIFGLVVLPSGNVMITDFHNRKIKTVHIDSGDVVGALTMTSEPSDVTFIGYSKAAVTLPNERKLQLLTVTDDDRYIALDHRINVDGRCVGIDWDHDTFLVSYDDPSQVQLISSGGIVLKTIRTDQRGSFIFRRPQGVAFARDKIHFYICDSETGEVMKVRRHDGIVMAINKEIYHPIGVVELPDENVLVAGKDTNAIHLLSPYLKGLNTVLSAVDGISRPRALCIRQRGNSRRWYDLIIGNRNGSVLTPYRFLFQPY